jgi:hypothetical protein
VHITIIITKGEKAPFLIAQSLEKKSRKKNIYPAAEDPPNGSLPLCDYPHSKRAQSVA